MREISCKSCVRYCRCWERSRLYPCRSHDDMYSPKKDGKAHEEIHAIHNHSTGCIFVASDDSSENNAADDVR